MQKVTFMIWGTLQACFLASYVSTTTLKRCDILNVMGDDSPHDDDVIDTNARLDPAKTSFVKVFYTRPSFI